MKLSTIFNKNHLNLIVLVLLVGFAHNAAAECVAGSLTMKAPLYTVTVDATKLLTYQQQIGTVTKKAILRKDCVGYTEYTITGTANLLYPDGTQLVLMGKNDFTSSTPKAIFLTVNNGSINTMVTASGAATGINSDPFSIYLNSAMVMRVKQPWK